MIQICDVARINLNLVVSCNVHGMNFIQIYVNEKHSYLTLERVGFHSVNILINLYRQHFTKNDENKSFQE